MRLLLVKLFEASKEMEKQQKEKPAATHESEPAKPHHAPAGKLEAPTTHTPPIGHVSKDHLTGVHGIPPRMGARALSPQLSKEAQEESTPSVVSTSDIDPVLGSSAAYTSYEKPQPRKQE